MRERLISWEKTLESFFLEAIFEERRDFKARCARVILSGCSKAYFVAAKTRRWLINH